VDRQPNQQDAALYQRCFSLFQSGVAAEARAWFFEHFEATSYEDLQARYPAGSKERHLLAEFLGFYESSGVLVSRGLLHEDVFFDAPFALELVWARIGPIIEQWQMAAGDPGDLGERGVARQALSGVARHQLEPEDRGHPTAAGTRLALAPPSRSSFISTSTQPLPGRFGIHRS
jgi:hypothetical protein